MFGKRSFVLFVAFVCFVSADVVCSEDELIKEIREDLEDNGKLDCLREIIVPPGYDETPDKTIRREAAEWNSDCAFEADNVGEADWLSKFQANYPIASLVDVNGDSVDADFAD